MSQCIKRHVLTNTKPCINKTIHALLMTGFAVFYMQDSWQYSINTEGIASLQLEVSMKDFNASYKDSQGGEPTS